MVETTDKDRSQKIMGYQEKNFWYFNNYACLDLIKDKRFECGNIYSPIFTKELTNIIDEYSKVSFDLIRGNIDTSNVFYKSGKYVFPFEWEHNRYTLDVLFFYIEDLQFLEGSNNRGIVTIKPYIEGQNCSKGLPYFPPNLEKVAMNKIGDLYRVRKLRKEIGREFDKNCIANFFDFHLGKYNGSLAEFVKYSMSFMLKLCLQDTYDNVVLMKEFKTWSENKLNELDLRLNIFRTKLDEDQAEENKTEIPKGVSLTHREIATLYFLNGSDLDYTEADKKAAYHGQNSRTSGKRLKEEYWNAIQKEELMNQPYNAEIYTYKNSFNTIKKIIPLLEKEEHIKLANEYLRKSENYKDVKSK